jgi:hypothetical protein
MQLIVEFGQGLNDANSYIDAVEVDNYLSSAMYKKFMELSADEQIDCMVIASLFIDYSFNWKGQQKTLEQGLNWPRTNVFFQGHNVPDNFIPLQIKKATVTAIDLILKFGINAFQKTGEAQIKKEKLGPMETEYFETIKKANLNNSEYSDINNILRGLFYEPNNGVMTAEVLRK